jgi:OOP family OmpA-OmpF porin
MRRFITIGLLTASAAFLPQLAAADMQDKGFYVGLGTGLSIPSDADITGTGVSLDAEYDAGYNFGGTFGYRYGNGFRSELEASFSRSSFDALNGVSTTGRAAASQLMINALYDYENASDFTPYVGVGAGVYSYEAENLPGVAGGVLDDEGDHSWAVQGIVGASYDVNPWLELFSQYQYVHTQDAELNNSIGTPIDVEHANNIIQVGFRVALNSPEAARDAAPAAAPRAFSTPPTGVVQSKQPYLVFFDFDKSTLTAEAKDVLKRAAGEMKEKGVVRIEVTGHADRAGSEKYNQGLSERRAMAVKQELNALGVGDSEIMTYAKGESQPLVMTKDGVREPQNRRVEVIYSAEE